MRGRVPAPVHSPNTEGTCAGREHSDSKLNQRQVRSPRTEGNLSTIHANVKLEDCVSLAGIGQVSGKLTRAPSVEARISSAEAATAAARASGALSLGGPAPPPHSTRTCAAGRCRPRAAHPARPPGEGAGTWGRGHACRDVHPGRSGVPRPRCPPRLTQGPDPLPRDAVRSPPAGSWGADPDGAPPRLAGQSAPEVH